ncbi:MAG: YkgJ family cysteine cluster protein [Phycisphaerae bacterium]
MKIFEKEKWYAAGLHFECAQCGNCCSGVPGYVWVTDEEIHAMADFLKLSIKQFSEKYLRRVHHKISLIELPDYDCVFLQRTAQGVQCRIYSVRPQQCRTWPFWKMNLTGSSSFLNNTQRCPGINRGQHFTLEEIEERVKKSPC